MNKKYKGILYIVVSAFCFALMNLFVRMAGDLPSIQKSFFRNFVAAIFACVILLKDNIPFRCKRENLIYLVLRAVFGTVGILCNFYAIDHLVLADASMLNKMSPFFAVIFSFLILKEKVTVPQALFVAGAFLGSLFDQTDICQYESVPVCVGAFGRNRSRSRLYDGAKAWRERRKRPIYRILFLGFFLSGNFAVADL